MRTFTILRPRLGAEGGLRGGIGSGVRGGVGGGVRGGTGGGVRGGTVFIGEEDTMVNKILVVDKIVHLGPPLGHYRGLLYKIVW